MGGVDLGADAQQEVADLELGLAEEASVAGGNDLAGDLEEFVGSGLADSFGELLGLGLLFRGKGGRHGASVTKGGGFSSDVSVCPLVYK
jgi:hypothetical protein